MSTVTRNKQTDSWFTLLQATEEKLQKDVADVARDRAGLQALIESLRRAEAETLHVQEQTRLTSQQTIEALQKER